MKKILIACSVLISSLSVAHAAEMAMADTDFGMGARGAHVTALQETLVEKGLLSGTLPKGYFGPATKRAVMQYQRMLGLKQTGYVGPMTRAKWKMMKSEMKNDGMMKKDAMMEKKDMMMKDDMKKDTMMKDEMKKDTMMKKEKGTYEAYAPEKLAWAKDGKVILFFHASWCPTCKAADAAINTSLAQIPDSVHILKTDYDSHTALKQKYGVTYQHTFVQVDSNGTLIAKWSGSSSLADILAKIQ